MRWVRVVRGRAVPGASGRLSLRGCTGLRWVLGLRGLHGPAAGPDERVRLAARAARAARAAPREPVHGWVGCGRRACPAKWRAAVGRPWARRRGQRACRGAGGGQGAAGPRVLPGRPGRGGRRAGTRRGCSAGEPRRGGAAPRPRVCRGAAPRGRFDPGGGPAYSLGSLCVLACSISRERPLRRSTGPMTSDQHAVCVTDVRFLAVVIVRGGLDRTHSLKKRRLRPCVRTAPSPAM